MFNWAKQQLANVAGTAEPVYGPSAIKTVGQEAEETKTPYTELSRDDFRWENMDSTNVETESFYLFSKEGHVALAQVIHSNVAGIRTTSQFNSKISYPDRTKPHLWCSTPLSNYSFSEDKTSFYADDCAMELSEDGTFYTIKSLNDDKCIVNVKVTRTAPAFQGGKTGKTLYGTDLTNPWGHMRHAFWPRCTVEGTMTTKDGVIDFAGGRALYSYAIQGMKPHHAAGRWNFVDFQGPTYSAILMEYTTPPSYGSTVVNVGGIAKDGELITASCSNKATHTQTKQDPDSEWPEPTHVKWEWTGTGKDSKPVVAVVEDSLQGRTDRVDVMAEVPGFVKTIVANAAGTKPYIYQYTPKVTLKIKIGDEEISEEGQVFSEATFITE